MFNQTPVIPAFFVCLGHGEDLIAIVTDFFQSNEIFVLRIRGDQNSGLTPGIRIGQSKLTLQAIELFTHNLTCGNHIIHLMLGIGIGDQRVNAIPTLGEVILRQCSAAEVSCVTAGLIDQRSQFFGVAHQGILCDLHACAEGEDTGSCLSGGQVIACSYQAPVNIVIIGCAIPQQS